MEYDWILNMGFVRETHGLGEEHLGLKGVGEHRGIVGKYSRSTMVKPPGRVRGWREFKPRTLYGSPREMGRRVQS